MKGVVGKKNRLADLYYSEIVKVLTGSLANSMIEFVLCSKSFPALHR